MSRQKSWNADPESLLRVGPGFQLDSVDPDATPGFPGRKIDGLEALAAGASRLAALQERLWAAATAGDQRRVLLVLQAMDCGGKDGTVRAVTRGMNPAGMNAVSFGPPSAEEREHDFLWRIRKALPAPGYVGVFNRSHYEDVLVVRVHGLVPEDEWRQRYDQINAFEAEAAGSGIKLVKVMLHISRAEQRKRLLDRLGDPTKYWKYNPGDIDERARWDDYQQAYQDALTRCSTEAAPWYVVPADRKWYRNWAVAGLLRETLTELDPHYPEPGFDVAAERAKLLAAD